MNVKRWIALLLALALTFGLTACSSKEASWQEQYDLGVRYLAEGNYEEAILAFTAAIEIDPKRAEAYTGRGDAYMQTGDPAQAEHDYRMAWELAPDDLDTAEKLADALVDQGILEEAAGILEDLIEKDPSNPDYYDKLADIYDQLGQPDKAEEVLQNGVDATGDEGLRQKLEEAQSGIPPVPDDGIQRQVMEISSGEELVELSYTSGPKDLEIRLGDGDYNVDGLMFMSAENVSIVGTGATRLVSASGAETIVSLYDCDNFLLYGLVMGHDLEPYMTCSTGVVASGDWFGRDLPRAHRIRDRFGALVCDMEAAAAAQVCLRNQVPFRCLKVVSDHLDHPAQYQQYQDNLPGAVARLGQALELLLEE